MIGTIAWHEFWFTVRKKSYYLVTLGMPLLVLGYIGMIALVFAATLPGEIAKLGKPTGVVDHSGILTREGAILADAKLGEETVIETGIAIDSSQIPEEMMEELQALEFVKERKVILFESVEQAKPLIEDKSLRGVFEVPKDYIESGHIKLFNKRSQLIGAGKGSQWLSKLISSEILKQTELTDAEVNRIGKSANSTEFEIGGEGEFEKVDPVSKGLSLGIPLAVAGLLVLALMMNASMLLASIAEEKENKVMEVIVSSVSADSLLSGKVLGVVMAGLLQIAIWMAMVSIIPWALMTILKEYVEYDINIGQLMISGVFMVVGFVFYGSLLAGMGSLGSTYKDCQQLSAAVILCACVPMVLATVFIADPNALTPRVLSFIPLFSPVGMTMRLGTGEIPMWEVILSLAILIVSTWFAIKISARLFRAGTLMRGKTPGPREIWKVLTQPQ